MDTIRMVRCIDCGFCGYYINFGRGPKWEELTTELRKAFEEGRELNPAGQVPGTGNWNFLRCLKNLHEWQNFLRPSNSQQDVRKALLTRRNCKDYFNYHPGFSAPQHYDIKSQQSGLHLEQWNTRIALLALVVAIVSLFITTLTQC